MSTDNRPLIAHVLYRFDVGGLENGVVNLINHLPPESYRHAVIALTEVTDFKRRVERSDVEFIALRKPPGHLVWRYGELYRLFRALRPAVVHTRNLAALEAQVPAWAARVPVRVHGEHGWDVHDLDGRSVKYRRVRRLYGPFVHRYVALSRDLERYLAQRVGIAPARIAQIYNGVDTERFRPAPGAMRAAVPGIPFGDPRLWVVGTVGRMHEVKDPLNLVAAFVRALRDAPGLRERLRLALVGDGPLRAEAQRQLAAAQASELAWLPGERADIPAVLRGFDAFALPSRAEGISNTILEAMASGLPVVATEVGGNAELVDKGRTGLLVPARDPQALGAAIAAYANDRDAARAAGAAGRVRVERLFSLASMVAAYRELYDSLRTGRATALAASDAATQGGGARA